MRGTILTPAQLEEFDRRGVLRLPGILAPDRVRRAREYVQLRLARIGLWKNGGWSLSEYPRPEWPATGPAVSRAIGNKHPDVESLTAEPALLAAVEALLGGVVLDRRMSGRPQILFSLPNAVRWTVPSDWHVDIPRLASGSRPGVQLFAFLDTVNTRGGGTLVIAGSHRLGNHGRFIRSRQLAQSLRREPFFCELFSKTAGSGDRASLLGAVGDVGGVALEVIELTGDSGDAYLTDLRVLHTGAPNTAERPRLMATHRFIRADVVSELTEGYGFQG